jgi:hypothetical protein
LPGVNARFGVLGAIDSVAPTLVSITASPTSIDTLPGPATVRIGVHVTDAVGEGVTQVSLAGASGGGPGEPTASAPSTGTRQDGWWYIDLTVPQGTPPGSFGLQVVWEDISHWRSATTTGPAYPGVPVLTPAQLGGWDGLITVVPH